MSLTDYSAFLQCAVGPTWTQVHVFDALSYNTRLVNERNQFNAIFINISVRKCIKLKRRIFHNLRKQMTKREYEQVTSRTAIYFGLTEQGKETVIQYIKSL